MLIKAKAAFIDRDGVINEEKNYVHLIEEFVLLPGVVEGLSLLQNAGYKLIVVTNQAGIARGYYKISDMERLHDYLIKLLEQQGVILEKIYHCSHHPEAKVKKLAINCECRKPAIGMLKRAEMDFNLDLKSSVIVGDKLSDVLAGKNAGLRRSVIVETGHKVPDDAHKFADFIAPNFIAAANYIVSL